MQPLKEKTVRHWASLYACNRWCKRKSEPITLDLLIESLFEFSLLVSHESGGNVLIAPAPEPDSPIYVQRAES